MLDYRPQKLKYLQGASALLHLKSFHPPKMTKNDMKCVFCHCTVVVSFAKDWPRAAVYYIHGLVQSQYVYHPRHCITWTLFPEYVSMIMRYYSSQ